MLLSKRRDKTPRYKRHILRVEFINSNCQERQKTLAKLRSAIGNQKHFDETIGYLDIYSKEYVNKNMPPSTSNLSKGKENDINTSFKAIALLDLYKGRFVNDEVFGLRDLQLDTKSFEKSVLYPLSRADRALPDDESKAPIQATDGACSLSDALRGMQLSVRHSRDHSSEASLTTSSLSFCRDSEQRLPTSSFTSNARYPDYTHLEARLGTFEHCNAPKNWPHDISIQDTTLLANHGFFFAGRADLCRCYLCGLGFKDWSTNDDILFVHLKYSPNCKHLIETIDPQLLSDYRPKENLSQDVLKCKAKKRDIQQKTRGYNRALTQPGAANVITHPEYQEYKDRLKSFNHWPSCLSQTPAMCAEAGFFHKGRGDILQCYACDGGLQRWDAGDQPWIEHAKWFPFCEHVKREKGEGYIRLVQAAPEIPVDELIVRETTEQGVPSDSPFQIYPPAATNVMELGFSKAAVSMAIDECKANNLKLTADNLTNVLLDKKEKGEVLPTDSPRSESPKMPGFNEAPKSFLQMENDYLKRRLLCIFCQRREIQILFIPCSHRNMCVDCSGELIDCPTCSMKISQKVKTYMS